MSGQGKGDLWDRVLNPWWGKVICGLIVLGVGIYLYGRLSALEAGEVDSMFVSRSTKVLYDLGGKYTASGIAAVAGLGLAAWGVIQLVRGKE